MTSNLGISAGLHAFFSGIGYVLATPRVWPLAAVPMVIMLILCIVFGVLGAWSASWLSELIFGAELETWGQVGYWSVTVLLALVAILLAVLAALTLAQPLSSFALEAIARRREESLTGRPAPNPPFIASLVSSVKVALATLVLGGAIMLSLLAIDVIFPFAVVVTIPVRFLVAGWLLAWNFIDYPLGLRRAGLRARLTWAGQHFGAFTAFGCAWSLCVVIPGMVLVILPMGVAGATGLVVAGEQLRAKQAEPAE